MADIVAVTPEQIAPYWPKCCELLQPMVDIAYGEVSLETIKEGIDDGTLQPILVFNGGELVCVCILGITDFPTGKKVMQMPYIGGTGIETWLEDGLQLIEELAKAMGCTHVRGCGRKGWERALPDRYKYIRTIYEAEL